MKKNKDKSKDEQIQELVRYTLFQNYNTSSMIVDPEGSWVEYDDYNGLKYEILLLKSLTKAQADKIYELEQDIKNMQYEMKEERY